MKGKDILINTILNGFQKNNGVASCYCFNQDAIPSLVRAVVEKYAAKHEKGSIFIGVDSYDTRKKILAEINNTNTNLNNCLLRVLSKDFINPRYSYTYDIIITVGLNDCFDVINRLFKDSHFTLSIFTKNIMNNDFSSNSELQEAVLIGQFRLSYIAPIINEMKQYIELKLLIISITQSSQYL